MRALSDELQRVTERAAGAEREASRQRGAAAAAEAAALEVRRLADENAAMADRLKRLEGSLGELLGSEGVGHLNQRQKIQYHLR